MNPEEQAEDFRKKFHALADEVRTTITGQDVIVEDVLTAIFAGGHVLLEGVPGLGKTVLVRSLAAALDLRFQRIQFTPDLMPADLLGTNILVEEAGKHPRFEFSPGPVFCNLLLGDEINRATPKTQSALLEAMQESAVTIAGKTRRLEAPFFVLATQNPLEMEGTYVLPEAQLDRFFFKLRVPYPRREAFEEILKRTTGEAPAAPRKVFDGHEISSMQQIVRSVAVPQTILSRAAELVMATHPETPGADAQMGRYVRYGASPRGGQAILLAAKVRALLNGRLHVASEDLLASATPALRHRILLTFEAHTDSIDTDSLILTACRACAERWGTRMPDGTPA
jgi:MoxR-like ATPase